jgi:hypothetical protein
MVDAAQNFLAAAGEASKAVWNYVLASSELLSAKVEAIEHADFALAKAREFDAAWKASDSEDEDVPEAFWRALQALSRFESAAGVANPLRVAAREEAKQDAEEVQQAMRGLLEIEQRSALGPLIPVIREQLRAQTRFVSALETYGDAALSSGRRLDELHAAIARVTLIFPPESKAPDEAERVKDELLGAVRALSEVMSKEEPPVGHEAVQRPLRTSSDAAVAFATHARAWIRRRWGV